ncbi:MAG: glycosyltransferase family 87 protein [Hyphomicrobiaceae bacterium]
MQLTNDRGATEMLAYIGLLASAALYSFFYMPRGAWDYNLGYWIGRDFVNFWAGGRLAWLGQTELLFETGAYNTWLSSQIAGNLSGGFIFSYPPLLVPLLLPFGLLPYGLALIVWTGLHLAALGLVARTLGGGLPQALLVLAAPAVCLAAFQGHMTASLAAVFYLVIVWRDTRPIATGLLLGLLTVKPQLGLVVGLIMLVEQRWQVIVTAAVTAIGLTALSILVLGLQAWTGFMLSTLPQQSSFLTNFDAGFTYFLVTPYASLRGIGLPHRFAMVMHLLVALHLLWGMFCLWRRAADTARAILAVALVTVLVTPYANLYDLTLTVLPVTALAVAADPGDDKRLKAWLMVLWLIPAFGLPLAIMAGPFAGFILVAVTTVVLVPTLSFASLQNAFAVLDRRR